MIRPKIEPWSPGPYAVRIYSHYIGNEFGIEIYAMLEMKSGKRHLTNEMELPNQDQIRTLGERGTYRHLDILEADTIKQVKIKETNSERISQKNWKATRDKNI